MKVSDEHKIWTIDPTPTQSLQDNYEQPQLLTLKDATLQPFDHHIYFLNIDIISSGNPGAFSALKVLHVQNYIIHFTLTLCHGFTLQ